MGKGTGLTLLIGGVLATQTAAYMLDIPHLGDLGRNIVDAAGDSNAIGAVIDTMWEFFKASFVYDKCAILGVAGQASMYGGIGNLIYNTIKRPEKEDEPQEESL